MSSCGPLPGSVPRLGAAGEKNGGLVRNSAYWCSRSARRAGACALAGALLLCAPSCAAQTERTAEPVEQDGRLLPATADSPAVTSTPREDWRQGEMPYLYQIDPQWADHEYGGGLFEKQGCGPTALCMVYVYLTGNTDLDPVQMADFSTQNGFATDEEGTSWTLMTEGAAALGLSSTVLPAVEGQIQASLEAGRPVICVMAPGTFTTVGHYIVLERMGADGKVVVHDSNSVGRSMRTWDLSLICAEAKNIWSFSAA